MDLLDDDIEQLDIEQLHQSINSLNQKLNKFKSVLNKKLIQTGRNNYLKLWFSYVDVPALEAFFLEHAKVDDFILTNTEINYTKDKIDICTCKWLSTNNDSVAFKNGNTVRNLKNRSSYGRNEIIIYHVANNLTIEQLTEYVIYTALKKNPSLLKITEDNKLFSV